MKKIFSLAVSVITAFSCIAQVGIGNTDPKASLDITASNSATPASTDGILIPRMDEFPATNPTNEQDGMMVFITGDGTPAKGFYFWDNDLSNWISITGASDADWYVTGSSNVASAITDNIVTQGNVTIGTDLSGFAPAKLLIKNEVSSHAYSARLAPEGSPSGTIYGLYTLDSSLIPSGAFNYRGLQNNLSTTHGGSTVGLYNNFLADGGAMTGVYNNFNNIDGVTGMRNEFTGSTPGSGVFFGMENRMLSSTTYDGIVYGLNNVIQAGGNGARYGLLNAIAGAGSGDKYGVRTSIDAASGGTHYGTYSDVQKASGYAAYFIGRTSLGTDPSTGRYLMPPTDGSAGQVITTDGSGNLSWQDASSPKSLVRATMSTNQSVASGATVTVAFDTENFDTLGDFNPSSYTFTAPSNGIYRINVRILRLGGGGFSPSVILEVAINGSVYTVSREQTTFRSIDTISQLSAGDTIEITVTNSTASSYVFGSSTDPTYSYLEIIQLQ